MKTLLNNLQKTRLITALTVISFNVYAGGDRDPILTNVLVDQLEISSQSSNPTSWDATAWVGKDWHKLYIKTEGDSIKDQIESENQFLYSTPIARYWDFQAGFGKDITPEHSQTWGIIALQGLAPYFFETTANLLVNNENIGLRISTEYEALFTQKLILTPSFKIEAYKENDVKMGIGSGLSSTELSIRLRYEFTRKFAPYIGVKLNNNYGTTANYIKNEGGKTAETSLVAGIRLWF